MKFDDMLNIGKVDIEKKIIDAISETRLQLEGLITDRTCLIYTSYLYNNLKKRNILAYIVDTQKDLHMDFLHYFIIVPKDKDNNYIIDLTYNQFKYNELFESIYNRGYQMLSDDMYGKYLNNIGKMNRNKSH